MKSVLQLYRYGNYLSLDVACGAMVCASFFARIMQVQLRPYGLASLGLTVWIIYTADHLLDARKTQQVASSQRHRFHQDNFWMLLIVLIVAAVIDLLLVFFIRTQIVSWGLVLSVIVLVYLLLQRRLAVLKELVISILYSAGVLLPALALTMMRLSTAEVILISIFTLTALINLVLFSWYDWQDDLNDHHISLVTYVGRVGVKFILAGLFLIQFALIAILLLTSTYHSEALIVTGMNVALLMLFLFPVHFSNQNLYRLVGDSVFLFPLLYLL